MPQHHHIINPHRLNIQVLEEMRFYWADSHSAALALAYRHPQQKQRYLAQAAHCRQQYEELGYQLRVAKHYRKRHTH